ncbi:hypothetical protein FB451DRAFT_1170322 [Mycena latifolia]|nr:hypothetical protein FB451DRAFT_1170322 [Mycena latifolia]
MSTLMSKRWRRVGATGPAPGAITQKNSESSSSRAIAENRRTIGGGTRDTGLRKAGGGGRTTGARTRRIRSGRAVENGIDEDAAGEALVRSPYAVCAAWMHHGTEPPEGQMNMKRRRSACTKSPRGGQRRDAEDMGGTRLPLPLLHRAALMLPHENRGAPHSAVTSGARSRAHTCSSLATSTTPALAQRCAKGPAPTSGAPSALRARPVTTSDWRKELALRASIQKAVRRTPGVGAGPGDRQRRARRNAADAKRKTSVEDSELPQGGGVSIFGMGIAHRVLWVLQYMRVVVDESEEPSDSLLPMRTALGGHAIAAEAPVLGCNEADTQRGAEEYVLQGWHRESICGPVPSRIARCEELDDLLRGCRERAGSAGQLKATGLFWRGMSTGAVGKMQRLPPKRVGAHHEEPDFMYEPLPEMRE